MFSIGGFGGRTGRTAAGQDRRGAGQFDRKAVDWQKS